MLPKNGKPFGPGGKDRLGLLWRPNRLSAQNAAQHIKPTGMNDGMKVIVYGERIAIEGMFRLMFDY